MTGDGVEERLDRLPLTRLHAGIVALASLGLLFDVAEAALSNALSAVFAGSHDVAASQLSLLLASVFIGGAVGAPLLGWIADRYGRRWTLTAALLLLAVASLCAAASNDLTWVTVFRVFSGLALGAYPPLIYAFLSDILPPARRGAALLLGSAFGFIGAPGVIFLIRWLTPLAPLGIEGWRWALIAGAIGALATAVVFPLAPESPRWLARMGRRAEAEAVMARFEQSMPLYAAATPTPAAPARPERGGVDHDATPAGLFRDPLHRRHTLVLGAIYFLGPWATIGFPLLSGAVLISKGFRVSESLLYLGIAMLGPTFGVLAGALFIDRYERRTTLIVCTAAMALLGLAFAASDTAGALMATGIAVTMIGAVHITTLGVYGAELFPTRARASAISLVWAVNRVASALVPLALLPLLKSQGAVAMFVAIAAALAVSIVILLAYGPRGLTGRPVK